MGDLAKGALKTSLDALMERDASPCVEVERTERETDFLNLEVEDACLELLSTRRLSERPFRFVATAMKISERFERIADLAVRIADLSKRGLPKPLLKPSNHLFAMGQIAQEMIDIDLEAISKDTTVAIDKLRGKDDAMDSLYERVYGDLVALVHQNPRAFDDAMLLLTIALTLERIGDMVCKIGNRLIYIAEGKRVWI